MTLCAKILGPLSGLRVLDLSSVVMGPYCTLILSQLGADVIKVEGPGGDIIRNLGRSRHQGMTGSFIYLNSGKRSIAIDLSKKAGQAICLRLAQKSDIFVHSIRPDAIKKLGLDYKAVSGVNNKIIYCNLFGFGRGGRYFGKPAYDDTIQAVSGLAMLEAEVHGTPSYVTSVFADKLTGMAAVYSILAAVIARSNGRGGQEIDVPMYETMVQCLLAEHATGSVFDPPLGPPVYGRTTNEYRRPFQTRDGFLSVIVYNQKQCEAFFAAIERCDLLADPRFRSFSARTEHASEYYEMLGQMMLSKTNVEWLELLDRAQVPCSIVNSTSDLYTDPHLEDVGFFTKFSDQWGEGLTLPRFPVTFHRTPAELPSHGPQLGADTADILVAAGFSPSEIDAFLADGVAISTMEEA